METQTDGSADDEYGTRGSHRLQRCARPVATASALVLTWFATAGLVALAQPPLPNSPSATVPVRERVDPRNHNQALPDDLAPLRYLGEQPSRGIRYAALNREARQAAPQVQAMGHAAQAYDDAVEQIDPLADNPTLQLMPGLRTQPDSDRGVDFQGTLTQPLRLGGLSGARRALARAAADQQRALALQTTVERVAEAHGLWFQLWHSRELLKLLGTSHELADELVAQTRAAVGHGLLTALDLAQAEAFAAELAVDTLDVEGRAHELGLQLAAFLGHTDGQPLSAQGPAPQLTLPTAQRLLQAASRMDQAPAVRAATAQLAAAQADQQRRSKEHTPPLSVGASLQREAPNAFVAFLSATLTLPLFDQGTLDRAETSAAVAEATAAQERARIAATHELARLCHEVLHQRSVVQTVQGALLPPLDRQQTATEQLFAVGEATIFDVLRARRTGLQGQRQLISAQTAQLLAEQQLVLFLESLGARQP